MAWAYAVLLAVTTTSTLAQAQGTGGVSGRVADGEGRVVARATVSLAALNRRVATDSTGSFVLTALPAGRHVIAVSALGFAERGAAPLGADRWARTVRHAAMGHVR